MKELATYTRPAFLGDHPPVLANMVLESDGTEKTVPGGSVLGRDKSGKLAPWSEEYSDACGVLAGDVVLPESGNVIASVYIHASVVAQELVFDSSVSEEERLKAIASLRVKGIYSDVTWVQDEGESDDSPSKDTDTEEDGGSDDSPSKDSDTGEDGGDE